MALCTVSYIKSKISTSTLTDDDILDIINETSEDILALCETTDESNPKVILAGKYAIRAAVLERMKTTGELAASYATPMYKQQNSADTDIERFLKKADQLIQEYTSVRSSSYSSPSLSIGLGNRGGRYY